MASGANQDPGNRAGGGAADKLLGDLLHTGEILDRHHADSEALDAARADIGERRTQLDADREAAERALVDDHNAKAGRLGEEAKELRDDERRLKNRRGRHQRKAGHLADELRELAADPEAERSTVIAYAAFAATRPDFTRAAVERMEALDELMHDAAGDPFAIVQRENFAFGRIGPRNRGLVVDTGADVHRTDVVRLPVLTTTKAKGAPRYPYFGFFSKGFDHPKDMYDTYDSIVSRSAHDDDVMNPDSGWSTMSHFNLEQGHLPLLHPADIEIADPDEAPDPGAPEEEEDGFWGRHDTLFTGPAAQALLHRVVDARLSYIEGELDMLGDSSAAREEFGRFMSIAARLDLEVDIREIPAHERLIAA